MFPKNYCWHEIIVLIEKKNIGETMSTKNASIEFYEKLNDETFIRICNDEYNDDNE